MQSFQYLQPPDPAVDGTFSPDLPGKLLLSGNYDKSLRVLVGHNADEGLYFTSPFILTNESFKQNVISVSFPDADKNNVTSYILDTLYPNVLDGTYGYNNSIARGAYIVSEAIFSCNAQYLERAFGLDNNAGGNGYRNGKGKENAWGYRFSVPPALHGDDISSKILFNDLKTSILVTTITLGSTFLQISKYLFRNCNSSTKTLL